MCFFMFVVLMVFIVFHVFVVRRFRGSRVFERFSVEDLGFRVQGGGLGFRQGIEIYGDALGHL